MPPSRSHAAALLLLPAAHAGLNGAALTPPLGWRTWNQFGGAVDQALLEEIATRLVDASRTVGGVPTSLSSLGFTNVGLDDEWQECGAGAAWGHSFHDGAGFPLVNRTRFPDLLAMTSALHALNLTAGFYANNCFCQEKSFNQSFYAGDVAAWSLYGFDALKIDGCGPESDRVQWWAEMEGTPQGATAVIETNGGQPSPGQPLNGPGAPMWHFYRVSTDIRPTYGSVLNNAQNLVALMDSNRTGPGCWAFSDMSVIGVTNLDLGGCKGVCPPEMTYAEQRSHWGLWCVASQPLTLSLDLRNDTAVDFVWPIITNVDALAINQAWGGAPGGVLTASNATTTLPHCDWAWAGDRSCALPTTQQWWKPLPHGSAAVLVMNNGDVPLDTSVDLTTIPGLACVRTPAGCAVKDVWAGSSQTYTTGVVPLPALPSHDSAFLWIS